MASGTTQKRNAEMVGILSADFQNRYEPNFAWKSAISSFLAIPGLRAFWPGSIVDYTTPIVTDTSGHGYDLTNNAGTVTFGQWNLAPIATFGGAANQYLSRADGGASNWADVIGTESYITAADRGLTIGGWFRFDNVAGSMEYLIAKDDVAADDRSYLLRRQAAGGILFAISDAGTAATTVSVTDAESDTDADTWYFCAGRFVPSTTIDVYVNNAKTSNAVDIPATIFDSTAPFTIGADGIAANLLDGHGGFWFLSACAVGDAILSSLYQQSRAMFGV